jgi:hypothetical protein
VARIDNKLVQNRLLYMEILLILFYFILFKIAAVANCEFRGSVSFLWLCKCRGMYRFAIYLTKICQKHSLTGRIVHYLAFQKGSEWKLSWPAG